MKKTLLFIGIAVIGLAVLFFVGRNMLLTKLEPSPTVSPPIAPSGVYDDMIRISSPRPGQTVKSPLVVTGEARGTWYFEASFPVRMYDANGIELGVIPAQAQGEWMTTEYVPFMAVLEFNKPTTATGTLVLQKDNPSGLPEHDAELKIPIMFDLSSQPPESTSGCRVTGCSGQLCIAADAGDLVTTCEYKSEYACYKKAKCERQEDGKCGWTPTTELATCLRNSY